MENKANINPTLKKWNSFINNEKIMKDSLLYSILKQANFLEYDGNERVVKVELKNINNFIMDKLNENRVLWLPIFKKKFIRAHDIKFLKYGEYEKIHEHVLKQPIPAVKPIAVAPVVSRPKLKRLIADIPFEIHDKARVLGVKRNCPMKTIIVRALLAYIRFEEKSD